MNKLYRRIDGVLHYHEAWVADGVLYEHWGVVGDRGSTKEQPLPRMKGEEEAVNEILRPAVEKGFQPIEAEDHNILLIEYEIDGMGTSSDLKKRHALEDRMKETLGWTGLGDCDGGSIGSGTMEVCCFVVDFEIARKVIEQDLAGTEFHDYARIFDEDEE